MTFERKRIKPIFLFADSQLLFHQTEEGLFLDKIRRLLIGETNESEIKAAYIGASNCDDPQFYEIFRASMQRIGISNCRMINSHPDPADTDFLVDAEIVLLAGGDTCQGLGTIKRNRWDRIITKKYFLGAILIGISAGAIQLGVRGIQYDVEREYEYNTLRLVPFVIDVHADDDWVNLYRQVALGDGKIKGYGIPSGAGIIYYPDMAVEAVRFPCTEIVYNGDKMMKLAILQPGELREQDVDLNAR